MKTSKKSKEEEPILVKKLNKEELKESLNHNLDNKKKIEKTKLSKNEYDEKYKILKDKYVKLCKEFTEIQVKLHQKDNEREKVLVEIREIQKNNSNLINNEISEINFNDKEKAKEKQKKLEKESTLEEKESINLIDRYKKTKKNMIKKPIRDTDMETDDSESEEISDSDSDSESSNNNDNLSYDSSN